jgi:hypothetical protein
LIPDGRPDPADLAGVIAPARLTPSERSLEASAGPIDQLTKPLGQIDRQSLEQGLPVSGAGFSALLLLDDLLPDEPVGSGHDRVD